MKVFACMLVAATSIGCGSNVSLGGEGEGGGDGGPGGTCLAESCSTPAGTVQPFSSLQQIYDAMEGKWRICSTFPNAPSDAFGNAYGPASTAPSADGSTVGGLMYFLVQGASGPVRGAGFDYQLTYDVSQEGPGGFQLNMHQMPNSGFGGGVEYSPCPQELELTFDENPGSSVLVAYD